MYGRLTNEDSWNNGLILESDGDNYTLNEQGNRIQYETVYKAIASLIPSSVNNACELGCGSGTIPLEYYQIY